MMKPKRIQPKFRFNKFSEIGSPDAETDSLLGKAFIEKDAFNALIDMSNQRSILIGRTGSGKSAILKQIESTQDKVCRIEPEAMSLRFLSNSTMLDYFQKIDVNLSFFYKILWKHVFIIELLRLHLSYDNQKKNNWFIAIKEKLLQKKNNPKRLKALEYFDKWGKEFWLDTEKRVKEIENVVHKKFENEMGAQISVLNAKLMKGVDNTNTIKSEIKNKAEHVISETLANDIHEIVNILNEEIFIDDQQKHFIIIDDLDKEWIPSAMRYDLIGAMIEVIKEFQIFRGVKIIISLRDNLYQLVFAGAKHKGGQREKFKPLYVDLEWTKLELQELLNKRLYLISDKNLDVKTVFEKKHRDKSGFDYMIERTFYRPRDVISYINHIIKVSANKSFFSHEILKKAEVPYSKDRLQAIEDEWGENYGDVKNLFRFLYGKYNGFNIRNIKEDDFVTILLEEKPNQVYRGELAEIIIKWQKNLITFAAFVKEVIYLLYMFGIIGIKRSPTDPIQYFYDDHTSVTANDITNDCKVYVHKAFNAALKINTKEMEINTF
ncbi:MAG: hypothetical protein ABIN95_08155 [Mucilaginibacter sp.]